MVEWAHLRGLPVHVAECPHASEAYRGEVRDPSFELGRTTPRRGDDETGECVECGAPTSRARCRKCSLLASP